MPVAGMNAASLLEAVRAAGGCILASTWTAGLSEADRHAYGAAAGALVDAGVAWIEFTGQLDDEGHQAYWLRLTPTGTRRAEHRVAANVAILPESAGAGTR